VSSTEVSIDREEGLMKCVGSNERATRDYRVHDGRLPKDRVSKAGRASKALIIMVAGMVGVAANESLALPLSGSIGAVTQYASATTSHAELDYEVVNRRTLDRFNKTLVELHAVVSGSVTEPSVRRVLEAIYDHAQSTQGFQHQRGRPSHIFIFLYPTVEHYESGMGQWIARLAKGGVDAKVEVDVRSDLISQLSAKDEGRQARSESARREIFKAIITAEDRAEQEALKMHPFLDPLAPGYSKGAAMARLERFQEARRRLAGKYKGEVAQRYGLTSEELDEISWEGVRKNWPMPPDHL
jgi:hypothetical protein